MQMREKVGKSRNTVFFQWFCSGGSKSQLAKAAGAEPAGQMRDEKLHAVVARSTFRSQNVQNTSASDHFWKLRCPKSARRCGAKHISKSKCTKHTMLGPLGSCDVEKVHAVVARSTFRSQHVKNTRVSNHFWKCRCRFASLHYITLHYTPLHCTALRYTTLHNTTTTTTQLHSTTLNHTTLHYITLHYTPLHSTTLHYTTLHYTTLPSTTLHYITLHYTPLQLQLHNYTPLQYTPLH